MVRLYKWWVVSGHTMEENREMISTHRDPWRWHTETPGGDTQRPLVVLGGTDTLDPPSEWWGDRLRPCLCWTPSRPAPGRAAGVHWGSLETAGPGWGRSPHTPSRTSGRWHSWGHGRPPGVWPRSDWYRSPTTTNQRGETCCVTDPSSPQASYHPAHYLQNPLSHLQSSVPRHSTITVDLRGKNSILTPPIQLCTSTHCWDTKHHV